MQTGLTSLLDKMISGAEGKSANAGLAQGTGEQVEEGAGQGKGSAIAVEFAKLLRVLRMDLKSEHASLVTVRNGDEGQAEDPDATVEPQAAEDGDANAKTSPSLCVPELLTWRWNHDEPEAGTAKQDGDADAPAVDEPADDLSKSVLAADENRQIPIPPLPAGVRDGEAKATLGGESAKDNEAVADDRKPDLAGRLIEPDTDADGGGGDPYLKSAVSQERASPVRDKQSGGHAVGKEAGSQADQGPSEKASKQASDHAPRSAGMQTRVEIVAGQTHLPPAPPASSTVQLLGESVGEALKELANTRFSNETAQDGETVHQKISRRLVVELHPRELGSVRITLVKQAGELRIEIVPTTDKANDLLASHRDALAHTIRHAGSVVGEITVRMSHDGGVGSNFQPGQNPASNWNGGNGTGGERSGDARHPGPDSSQGGQYRQDSENRPESERPSRNGVYL